MVNGGTGGRGGLIFGWSTSECVTSVHGLEGSTDAATLQFSAVAPDDFLCLSYRGRHWGPEVTASGRLLLLTWPRLFFSSFLDTRHLLSLDRVVDDGGRPKTGNHL